LGGCGDPAPGERDIARCGGRGTGTRAEDGGSLMGGVQVFPIPGPGVTATRSAGSLTPISLSRLLHPDVALLGCSTPALLARGS
jgi:hypothetical protein